MSGQTSRLIEQRGTDTRPKTVYDFSLFIMVFHLYIRGVQQRCTAEIRKRGYIFHLFRTLISNAIVK